MGRHRGLGAVSARMSKGTSAGQRSGPEAATGLNGTSLRSKPREALIEESATESKMKQRRNNLRSIPRLLGCRDGRLESKFPGICQQMCTARSGEIPVSLPLEQPNCRWLLTSLFSVPLRNCRRLTDPSRDRGIVVLDGVGQALFQDLNRAI